ncbi:unnamed protein product [Heterobilharzia americana]|nr:unnamed protein product [Heterobilharzia americana]
MTTQADMFGKIKRLTDSNSLCMEKILVTTGLMTYFEIKTSTVS